MRTYSGWALVQALVCAVGVSGFSLSDLISDVVPLKIATDNTAQKFEGWGTSLAWFAEYIGCLEDSQQERVADLLFDAETGLGLQIVRYNIGGSNTTLNATNSMRPFAAVPSMLLANGTYNWALDIQQAEVMLAAQDRGALIFEAFSNSPPWFMTMSGDPSGNVNGTSDNLAPANYDAFVDYLTEVVQYYREEKNITFRTVEPFNEPSSTEWQLGNIQEGCHYNPLTQDSILQKLAASLDAKGLSPETGISASDEDEYGTSIATFLQYGAALSVIDQISTHAYQETLETVISIPLDLLASQAGKRLWMTEYAGGSFNVSDIQTGLALSTQILGDLKNGGVQAWIYWQAVENIYGPGGLWGFLQMPFGDYGPQDVPWPNIPIQISKQYYAMMQYSKFIKNGWTILSTDSDVWTLAAMYQDEESNTDIAVVTTNTESSSTNTNWQFGSMSSHYVVEVFRTSATENCTQLTDVVLPSNGVLQYTLPSNSITTFHFTIEAEAAVATAG